MPNIHRDQTMYVQTADPDTWHSTTLQREGELGKAYDVNDRTYQRVKLDSGATSSTSVGAVAANQLAFWKDRSKYLVTNDKKQAEGGSLGTNAFCNSVAGIFRHAISAGEYCDILVRGRNIAVSDDNSSAVGEILVAGTTDTDGKATGISVGTAPTYITIGRVRTASAANVCYADVDIGNIP